MAAAALWQSRGFGVRAGLFPWAIGFPLLALGVLQLYFDVARSDQRPATLTDADLPPSVIAHRTAVAFGWIVGFPLAIWLLGLRESSRRQHARTAGWLLVQLRRKSPRGRAQQRLLASFAEHERRLSLRPQRRIGHVGLAPPSR